MTNPVSTPKKRANDMNKVILRWVTITGIAIFFISVGFWIVSFPFGWAKWLVENDWISALFRIFLTAVGILVFWWAHTKRERFLSVIQEEGLDASVSVGVFKTLINKVLEGFDGITLEKVAFKKSKFANITDLVIELKVNDPYSLSEVLKEIHAKVESSIRENIGEMTGIHPSIKVRGFEVKA